MNPCPFKVYKRTRGQSRKTMIARFADRTEAVNYGFTVSKGRWNFIDVDVLVYNYDDRILVRIHRGAKA